MHAYSAAQVKAAMDATKRLGGENYVFWGGREGYHTLLNTNLKCGAAPLVSVCSAWGGRTASEACATVVACSCLAFRALQATAQSVYCMLLGTSCLLELPKPQQSCGLGHSWMLLRCRLELDNLASFLKGAVAYKKKIGFQGALLLEPKPQVLPVHSCLKCTGKLVSLLAPTERSLQTSIFTSWRLCLWHSWSAQDRSLAPLQAAQQAA